MTFGTGFGKLGASFGTLGASSGGALPWNVGTGLLAFEDMSQSQLQSGLTALGFTQTRTGTALRTQTGTTAGSWYEVSANVLGMMPGSTSRYGLFVGSAVTNRCLYSNNMTNSAWTKTSTTATLATGGLVRDADWRGVVRYTVDFSQYADKAAMEADGWTLTETAGSPITLGPNGITLNRGDSPEAGANISRTIGASGTINFTLMEYDEVTAGVVRVVASGWSVGSNNNDTVRATNAAGTLQIFAPAGFNTTATIRSVTLTEVDAHTVLTATSANGTCVQTITDTSNERLAGAWVRRSLGTGRVWMSQGAVTGSELVTNGDGTNLTGWTAYEAATPSVVSNQFSIDISTANDPPGGGLTQTITTEVGKYYKVNATFTKNTSDAFGFAIVAGSASTFEAGDPGYMELYFVATSTSTQLIFRVGGGGTTGSFLLDDISCKEVAETELSLDSTIQLTRTPAATITNPQIAFRFETSGDSIEVYNVNAQRGTVLEDPIVTAASTVTRNAETCSKTMAEAPTSVDVTVDLRTPSSNTFQHILSIGTEFQNGIMANMQSSISVRATQYNPVDGNVIVSDTISLSTDHSINVVLNATIVGIGVDGGALATSPSNTVAFGSLNLNLGFRGSGSQFDQPIYRITGIPQ